MTTGPKAVVVGEGMLELSCSAEGTRLGYGGDTLNTAIHLARLGVGTAYFTALGSDPLSDDLRREWAAEGLDTSLVLTDPERHAGLYAIRTDAQGERSFTYWRGDSAARRMFALPQSGAARAEAERSDLLYFSLISLAILPERGREELLQLARAARDRGGKVAFDGNFRPRLWASAEEARQWRDAAIAVCDIGLPTFADERELSGEPSAAAVADHWRSCGARELIAKLGSDGCWVDGTPVPPPKRLEPLDTSGAGDAFNAGYLAARLRGRAPEDAALAGHELAGWVVMRRGAIPQRDREAPYA